MSINSKELEYDHHYKIIVVGDICVGKTNIITRCVHNEFSLESKNTIGVEFFSRDIYLKEHNANIKLQIWDTAGQERFTSITEQYFRNSHGAIIVYDVTKRKTFENVNKWYNMIKKYNENIIISIVGNKCDLTYLRDISTIEGYKYSHNLSCLFTECSALEENHKEIIDNMFLNLTNNIFSSQKLKDTHLYESNIQIPGTIIYNGIILNNDIVANDDCNKYKNKCCSK